MLMVPPKSTDRLKEIFNKLQKKLLEVQKISLFLSIFLSFNLIYWKKIDRKLTVRAGKSFKNKEAFFFKLDILLLK